MDISPTIKAVSLCSLIFLTACQTSNEGFIDYRKADINNHKSRLVTCPKDFDTKKGTIQCVVPSELGKLPYQNKPIDKKARIPKDANLSVHLCSAYIRDFHETFNIGPKNGEIAIVANVFEMDGANDFDHNDSELKQGRLVFYSPDVRPKQKLNFHNMPIYGPKTYGGAPLGIQLAIFELDNTPDELKSVLDFAANAGAKSYPPASPILKILNGLGKSFLNGGKNDIEFKYSMVLSHSGGYLDTLHPVIEAGYYVFIREEERDLNLEKNTKWDSLKLNMDTCTLENDKGAPYTQNTYLVVAINKGESSLKIDLSQNTYGKFLKKLGEENDKQFTELRTALTDVLTERVQTQNFATAKNLIATAKGQSPGIPNFAMQDLIGMLTKHVAEKQPEKKLFSPSQLRFIQAELFNFANANGQSLSDDEVKIDNLVTPPATTKLFNAVKSANATDSGAKTSDGPIVKKAGEKANVIVTPLDGSNN